MIVDSNILIDALKAKPEAVNFLGSNNHGYTISVISIAELYAGVRDGRELKELQKFLHSFSVHPIDATIAVLAGQYKKKYSKSHNLDLGDALIAATATISGEELATLNTKHFPMLNAVRPY